MFNSSKINVLMVGGTTVRLSIDQAQFVSAAISPALRLRSLVMKVSTFLSVSRTKRMRRNIVGHVCLPLAEDSRIDWSSIHLYRVREGFHHLKPCVGFHATDEGDAFQC